MWCCLLLLVLVYTCTCPGLVQCRINCDAPSHYNCGRVHTAINNTAPICCCHHKKSGTFIDCSRRNLTAVPTQLPSAAISLNMNHNNISGEHLIRDQPFQQFSNLRKLLIADNKICHIEESSFNNLTNLRYLDITVNCLRYDNESIPPTAFRQLKNLDYMTMKQNWPNFTEEETCPDTALSELTKVKTLIIDMPDTTFGEGFRKLKNLKYLQLADVCCKLRCNVPVIDKTMFTNTPGLIFFGISSCNVKQIMYDAFGSLYSLKRLDLSWNDKLTFKCMYNMTSGLRKTKLDMLWLIGLHDYYSECNILTAEHLQFLYETNVTNLALGSNRISGFTMNATNYIPRSLIYLSLNDNMFLYGEYVKKIFNENLMPNLGTLVLGNQFESKVPGNLPPYHTVQMNHVNQDSDIWIANDYEKTGYMYQSPYRFDTKRGERSTDTQTVELNNDCPESSTCVSIPSSLEVLIMSNMRIRMPLAMYNLTTQPNKLNQLMMNRNMFLKWYGPIIGFNALGDLDLSENGCDYVTPDFFYDMPELKLLNLSYNYLGESLSKDKHGKIFYHLKKLINLDISNNKITYLQKKIFSGLENLELLNVSDNQLIKFDIELEHMRSLSFINLTGNVLDSLPESLTAYLDKAAASRNMTISLMKNNIKCDCDHQAFLNWMLNTRVQFVNMSSYKCTDVYLQQQTLSRYQLRTSILPSLRKACYNYTWVYISSSVVATLVIGSIVGSTAYRNRYRLYYLYYKVKFRVQGNRTEHGYIQLYNQEINVSYTDTDSDTRFVIGDLRTELEDVGGFSLYVEDRDGELGECEAENIIRGIMESRITLIIFTKDYVRHHYCRFILNMVRETAIERNAKIMFFMLKGISANILPQICTDGKLHLEILKMMTDTNYAAVIDYPDDVNDLPTFWDSLRVILRA